MADYWLNHNLGGNGGGGSPEGTAVKSTGESAGEVLMTNGEGGAVWTPDMTDTEIELLFLEKGTVISMNLDGTDRNYRVIKKVSGSVVEVLTQFDPFGDTTTKYNETSTEETFSDGSVGQKYAGSTVDTAINTTWYNTLSSTAKAAIVDKNIVQDMWYTNSSSGDPDYRTASKTTSKKATATLAVGNRHIYLLSVQDMIDYLEVTPEMTAENTTWTQDSFRTMFGYDSSSAYQYWVSSARATSSTPNVTGIYIAMNACYPDYINVTSFCRVRPAFQIDLSKISYTEV